MNVSAVVAQGGFKLVKWVSNSREFLSAIPKCDRAKYVMKFDLAVDDLPTETTLDLA